MGRLIAGITICILPIFTWFSDVGFVPAVGATLFYWAIGGLLILVGLDKVLPKGLWPSSGTSEKREVVRYDHYNAEGEYTGYTEIPK